MLTFDHLLLPAVDLDAAAAWLEAEHGLPSVPGGRHQGHGTANRIAPLGDGYLELVGVVDPAEAASSPFGRWVERHAGQPCSLVGLCLGTDEPETLARRLDLEPVAMSRTTPDGTVLRWRLLGLDAMVDEGLPFFISWDVPAEDRPGRTPVPQRTSPAGISWVEVGGDSRRLAAWVGAHALDLRGVGGTPGVHAAGIATSGGEVVVRRAGVR